jgi:hypothetical protein
MISRRSALRLMAAGVMSASFGPRWALAAGTEEQAKVPLEEQPTDAKLAKIVLVAGLPTKKPGEHEYFAGCAVLQQLLKQTPGVFPVLARDGWPTNPKTFENARAVVFFLEGGGNQALLKGDHPTELQRLADAGVGFVNLHSAIDYPKDFGERARSWLGGCYEPQFSKRAHWIGDFSTFPEHAITRGVRPFKINDGWLTNSRFVAGMKGVTPLLRTAPPPKEPTTDNKPLGDDTIVSWAYDRPNGGRAFAFSGGHLHSNFTEEGYRRFLVNGILWSAKVDVPERGAPVNLDPEDLKKNLDNAK